MRIAVGSTNPVKRGATEDAFASVAGVDIESVAVDSGVSEQPTGHAETIAGAETRARRALAAGVAESSDPAAPRTRSAGDLASEATGSPANGVSGPSSGRSSDGATSGSWSDSEYDLGVGIEGGVAEFDGSDGLYLVMWAAVTDGETVGQGAGPSIRLPDDIAARVREGEELGPVMDDAFDHENSDGRSSSGSGAGSRSLKENEGAAGVLSGNIIDRRGALTDAVAGALGPFVTDAYE